MRGSPDASPRQAVAAERAEEHGACRRQGSPYFRRSISGSTPTYISDRQSVDSPVMCVMLFYNQL